MTTAEATWRMWLCLLLLPVPLVGLWLVLRSAGRSTWRQGYDQARHDAGQAPAGPAERGLSRRRGQSCETHAAGRTG